GAADVRKTVADIADPVLSADVHGNTLPAHHLSEAAGEFANGVMASAADVEHAAGGIRAFQGEAGRARNIVDADEVALLLAIFEDEGRMSVEQARGEDGHHAGIRIGKRLARTVDVEETEGDGRNAVRAAEHEAELLLVEFGERIDGGEGGGLGLRCRDGSKDVAISIAQFPVPGLQLRQTPFDARHQSSAGGAIQALAVNAHGGGHDEALDGILDERLQEDGRALVIDGGVVSDLIHALADTHQGGKVEHGVHALEGADELPGVADIAVEQLDLGVEVIGASAGGSMDLRGKAVENAYVITLGEQFIREVRANETGASRYQNSFVHLRLKVKFGASALQ